MSQESIEIVHRFFEAANRHDVAAFVNLSHPDVGFRSLVLEVEGDFCGHDGVRAFWTELFRTFPDWRVEVEEIRDLGDSVVVRVHAVASGAASGAPIDQAFWQALTVRDGKAVWWAFFRTEAEALEAVGLRE